MELDETVTSRRSGPLRVVICGTTFGQVYLEAFRVQRLDLELAGILGRGSERSRSCSEFYGVPLFTRAADLPANIDVACVIVRSSLLGGEGTELARELMSRGIHVLQEHPLHHDELAECLREAHRCRVHYRLNSFYPYLSPVERFVSTARQLLVRRRALYIDAACSFQVCYALFDILWTILGRVKPSSWTSVSSVRGKDSQPEAAPVFRSADGVFAGVPLSLRIQNQVDPSDPDNGAHLLQRITLGTDAGELTLVTTHGPVVWSARPAIPREVRDSDPTQLFGRVAITNDDVCTALMAQGEQASQRHVFRHLWPAAAGRAMVEFGQAIQGEENSLAMAQHHLALCRVWQDLARELGPPELVQSQLGGSGLSPEELAAMRDAAGETGAGSPNLESTAKQVNR